MPQSLSGATFDPTQLRRRIAQQLLRSVPADESLYRDFRSDGGPMRLSQGEIERAIIATRGEPLANLTGKRDMGGGPFEIGDVDAANQGFLQMLGNAIGHYDYAEDNEDTPNFARWIMSLRGANDFAPFLSVLNDNDALPRTRIIDVLLGGVTIGATPNGNYKAAFPYVAGGYDFHGVPVQTEGGATAIAITSITSSGTTATVTTTAAHSLATGDKVRIVGATQTEYNGDYTVTVTGGSTFTYTFAGSGTTPATGTITYEKLNSDLPIVSQTWPGNWVDDDTDRDLYLKLVSYDAPTTTWTVQAKVTAAAAWWSGDLAVSGITRSGGVATVTTGSAHSLITGDVVYVQGATQTAYNGQKVVTVTGASTFTFEVDSSTTTPATGTITLDRRLISAKVGLDSAGNPIQTRLFTQSGSLLGKFSEQLRLHLPAGYVGTAGDEFKIPNRRHTRWVQTLDPDRPISSVNTAIYITPESGSPEEIRFEGGVAISITRPTLEAKQDTPGVQGATVQRFGDLMATVVPTRQITDLRFQKAIHERTPMVVVVESKSDVFIGSTGRPYRVLWIFPSCIATGEMVDVPAGGGNTYTEAPVLRASVPDSTYTFADDFADIAVDSHFAVVVETDILESDVIAA